MDKADLEFDTSDLEGNEESYSSLTDANDILVFTDEFEEMVFGLEKKEIENIQSIGNQIFLIDVVEDQSDKEIITELFQGKQQQIVRKEETDESKKGNATIVLGILMAIFLWIMVTYVKMRKQKREDIKNSAIMIE